MLNYLAKYSIGEYNFTKITDTAFVGILEVKQNGLLAVDLSTLEPKAYLKRSITIGSRLGGGAGFPAPEHVLNVMTNEHCDLKEAFVKTISQEKVILFNDGERYSHVMMQTLVPVLKKFGKHVSSIALLPPSFYGNKALDSFNNSWEFTKTQSDESIAHNVDYLHQGESAVGVKLDDIDGLRKVEIMKKIAQIESGLDAI